MRIHSHDTIRSLTKNPFQKDRLFRRSNFPDTNYLRDADPGQGPSTADRFISRLGPMVPQKTEQLPDTPEQMLIRDEWNDRLNNYRLVQTVIDQFLAHEATLKDPSQAYKNTDFKKTREKIYGEIHALKKSVGHLNLKIDWSRIEKTATGQVKSFTEQALKDVEAVIKELTKERAVALEILRKAATEDFERRANLLKNQWKTDPILQKNYSDSQVGWEKNLDELLKKVSEIPKFDDLDPRFPKGSQCFQNLEKLWEKLCQMEDTINMLKNGQNHDLSPQKIKARLDQMIELKKQKVTRPLIDKNKKRVEEVTAKLDEMIALAKERIEAYSAQEKEKKAAENDAHGAHHRSDNEDKESDELKAARKGLENLEKTRLNLIGGERKEDPSKPDSPIKKIKGIYDLEATIDEVFFSEEIPEGNVFPKGIVKQYKEILVDLPMSAQERRHAMVNFNNVLDDLEIQINGVDTWIDVYYTDIEKELNLIKMELDIPPPKKGWRLQRFAIKPTFDTVWHVLSEAYTKSLERDQKLASTQAATQIFKSVEKLPDSPIPGLETIRDALSSTAAKMPVEEEHAMVGAVSDWAHQYEHASVQHVTHRMHDTMSQYEFKACCDFLAKKGALRMIDDESFFKQLNHFLKGQMTLPTSKHWHLVNRQTSESMLRQALFKLYMDIDLYNNWRQQNTGAITSEGGKFDPKWSELSEVKGGLTAYAQSLLDRHLKESAIPENHGSSTVDSNEYESIVNYSVKNGKMDAEDPLYFMIQGIAHGLISIERASVFCEHCNTYAASELFASKTNRGDKPTIEDIKEWAAMSKEEYVDWYHSYVMYLPRIASRIAKASTQGVMCDHDYFTAAAPYYGAEGLETICTIQNTRALQVTAVQNGAVGMLFALDTLANGYNSMGDAGREGLIRLIDAATRLDGIAYGRYEKKKNMVRLTQTDKNAKPRYSGNYSEYYGRGGRTTDQYFKTLRDYLVNFDVSTNPDAQLFHQLFGISADGEFARPIEDEKVPKLVETMINEFGPNVFGEARPKTVDELYKSVGAYMQFLSTNYKDHVQKAIEGIRKDHKTDKKLGGSMKDFRAKRDQKFKAAQEEWAHVAQTPGLKEAHHHRIMPPSANFSAGKTGLDSQASPSANKTSGWNANAMPPISVSRNTLNPPSAANGS